MSYISIYRKYRPQSFAEVVGQDEIVKTLQNSIKSNRLSHAYIFCGPRGTGKTTTARIFAKAVNCLNNVDKNGNVINPEPCNKCSNCLDITNGMSVDLIEIDAASNTGIDNVRKLIENAQYLPNFLRKKIYIIDEIHNIGGGTTKAAFHALLKILEEPPENVIFILATTEPQKVIPTILSRCQRFDFKPISADAIKERLKVISKSENIEVSDAALNLISKYSDGSQRDANVILEKIASLDEDKIQVEDVVSLLGAVDLEILFELTDILVENNSEEAVFFISRLEKLHQNLEVFVEKLLDHLQNLYFIKNNPEGFDYINTGIEYKEKYVRQSRIITNFQLSEFISIFMDLLNKIKSGHPAWVLFKSAVIKALNINTNLQLDKNTLAKQTGKEDEKEESSVGFSGKSRENPAAIKDIIDRLERSIEELKERFANFQGSFQDVLKIAAKSGDSKISKNVDNLKISSNEESKNYTLGEDNLGTEKLQELELKLQDKDKDSLIKKSKAKSPAVEITKTDWENILGFVKNRSISLNSLLSEVKKYNSVEDKLFFYLSDNYGWHKDKLNKPENIEIIRNAISSVIDRKFKIEFFLESQGKELIDLKKDIKRSQFDPEIKDKVKGYSTEKNNLEFDSSLIDDIEKDVFSDKDDDDFNKFVAPQSKSKDKVLKDKNSKEKNPYEYLEKKFRIKENKNGN